jgi:hypothetical protein
VLELVRTAPVILAHPGDTGVHALRKRKYFLMVSSQTSFTY